MPELLRVVIDTNLMMSAILWVEQTHRLDVCTDENDNRFLECAVEGHAAYLVTKIFAIFRTNPTNR